jgi:hypothetical protein
MAPIKKGIYGVFGKMVVYVAQYKIEFEEYG